MSLNTEHEDARDRSVTLVTPDRALLERLLPVARRIFTDTFASRYDPDTCA